MNKTVTIIIAVIFGWMAGITHSYIANLKTSGEERHLLDRVERTMQEGKPFKLFGQFKFYPTSNGYQVVNAVPQGASGNFPLPVAPSPKP